MRAVVVGGHTRNIGKTALVVDLIRAFPEAAWTAVKITQYGHGECSIHGEPCGCTPEGHDVAFDEETSRENRTDTSRFLVAGAARSYWLRVKEGHLAEGMPALRSALEGAGYVLIESNTLLKFLHPELYLVVLEPRVLDFKESAREMLDRADAFVLRSPLAEKPWPGVSGRLLERKPRILHSLGGAVPEELLRLVRERVFISRMV